MTCFDSYGLLHLKQPATLPDEHRWHTFTVLLQKLLGGWKWAGWKWADGDAVQPSGHSVLCLGKDLHSWARLLANVYDQGQWGGLTLSHSACNYMTKLNKWHGLCIFLFLSTGRIFRHQIKSTQRASVRGGREGDLYDNSTLCMCAAGCIKTDCIWVLLRSLFCHSTFCICLLHSVFLHPHLRPPVRWALSLDQRHATTWFLL